MHIMRTRYSIILPIVAIISGVVLTLNSFNLLGGLLPNDINAILLKIWPLVLVFIGLDLILSQRRYIGGLVVLFVSAALLSTQFLDGGQNNEIWKLFMRYWPILLILFGIDWIFSGRTLVNTIVIIAGGIILIFVLLTFFDVPVAKKLPISIDLKSMIPTSVFNEPIPVPQNSQQMNNQMPMVGQQNPQPVEEPITSSSDGQISVLMPAQSLAVLNMNAASGTIAIKAGETGGRLLSGRIALDAAEKLNSDAKTSGQTAQYTLSSSGRASSPQSSQWDLQLTGSRTIALNTVLNSGYIKADLRSLTLSEVNLENKYGPIDVMVPNQTDAEIKLTASGDVIRVYVPTGSTVSCTISGASRVEYPQWEYTLSGNQLTPRRSGLASVNVVINANGSSVQIINIG